MVVGPQHPHPNHEPPAKDVPLLGRFGPSSAGIPRMPEVLDRSVTWHLGPLGRGSTASPKTPKQWHTFWYRPENHFPGFRQAGKAAGQRDFGWDADSMGLPTLGPLDSGSCCSVDSKVRERDDTNGDLQGWALSRLLTPRTRKSPSRWPWHRLQYLHPTMTPPPHASGTT